MDTWKFYGITHSDHLICNPTSEAKLDELVNLLPLEPDPRILDVACGKGELLIRIAKQHAATGVGVDISPYEIEAARRRVQRHCLERRIELILEDGSSYSGGPESFSLAMCIGATWVFGGYEGTIETLKGFVKPGGLIAIGEPFKMKEPDAEFMAAEPDFVGSLKWHHENVSTAQRAGLTHLYSLVSDQDDWDRYEGLKLLSAEMYATRNPKDPDNLELLERQRTASDRYLRRGRDTVSWAIYLYKA